MKIEPCPLCGRDNVDVEFRDTISHNAYVECLYEFCRYTGDVAKGNTKEEAIDKATELWNNFSEKRIEQQKLKQWDKEVTYKDYYEPSEEQTQLDNLIQRIIDLQEEVPPEFEETFKKRFKDILA